ncbi:MAG TPA: nucleoside triphosphate pyrophosphohydrolase [Alphaproteobacteria bacterium]|nr:nucleoside triphosphate pyrophosphohydrolase [Alphaproteobacteria bacterium]
MKPSRDIARLIELMAALRTPGSGCPWDLEQNFETIAPYTLEEAYEVADAIARGDLTGLKDELGDLLLQVVFHARMAEEQGAFDFGDVVEGITAKLVRRHPHVFADEQGHTAQAVKGLWERVKAQERAEHGGETPAGALAGVPVALPALTRALKLQEKASRVGFDWRDPRAVLAKIREEADEIEADTDSNAEHAQAAREVGDLLFAVVNLARHFGADPEGILRATNLKFEHRFAAIERALAERGKTPEQSTLAEMDALWDAAKEAEKAGIPSPRLRPASARKASFGGFESAETPEREGGGEGGERTE